MQRRGLIVVALACLVGACSTDPGVRSTTAGSIGSPASAPVTEPSAPTATTATSSVPGSGDPLPGEEAGLGDELFPDLGFAGIDVEHYDVELTYDPVADSIQGSVGLDLVFSAPLQRMALDSVGLDIASVEVDGVAAATHVAEVELWIDLPEQVAVGERARVEVVYSATPSGTGSAAGIPSGWFNTYGGSYVLNEPDGARTWMPCNDHPSDKATFTFTVTVPAGVTAVANGGLTDHRTGPSTETWVWDEEMPMATYLIQLLTGDYEIIEGTGPGGVPLVSAVLREDLAAVQQYLEVTPEQIEFFTGYLGPYPLDRYGIAITDSAGGLAMETHGRSLFSQEDLAGELGYIEHLLLSHELAHQWFGDAVTLARWVDIWLNESFATYAEWLWLEHVGYTTVDGSAEASLTNRFPGATGNPTTGDMFGTNSYDGGAVVLHALRLTIGDDNFFTLLQRWVAENVGESLVTSDFIALAEEVSGLDLGDFFDTWLFAAETPSVFP